MKNGFWKIVSKQLFPLTVVLVLFAFITNPDENEHLEKLADRDMSDPLLAITGLSPLVAAINAATATYNDYFVFSTVTYGNTVSTRGAFGKVWLLKRKDPMQR